MFFSGSLSSNPINSTHYYDEYTESLWECLLNKQGSLFHHNLVLFFNHKVAQDMIQTMHMGHGHQKFTAWSPMIWTVPNYMNVIRVIVAP